MNQIQPRPFKTPLNTAHWLARPHRLRKQPPATRSDHLTPLTQAPREAGDRNEGDWPRKHRMHSGEPVGQFDTFEPDLQTNTFKPTTHKTAITYV